MTSGSGGEGNMKTRIGLIFAVMTCVRVMAVAQGDSLFSLTRNGVRAEFNFLKFTKTDQFKTIPESKLPMYSFSRTQYMRIKALLANLTQLEAEYRLLAANRVQKDSVQSAKDSVYVENLRLQQSRAENFQTSYVSVLNLNEQLTRKLKNAEQLAIHEHKKRKLSTLLAGLAAFSAGIIISLSAR